MSSAYHLAELEVVQDRTHPKRIVPSYPCQDWVVLDVGCGMGQTLIAPEFNGARELHGIDPDPQAIAEGLKRYPHLHLRQASAESLPYPDAQFDLVCSRVSLLYSDMTQSFPELYRVAKPGAQLWITLHPLRMELRRIRQAITTLNVKRVIDRAYVMAHSVWFALTGKCFQRPWHPSYESFQTSGGVTRALRRAGFTDIVIRRGAHFLVTARKP